MGAALHYMHGRNGVKDFDVWSFYAQYDDWPSPARWRGTRDFGPSKFGRYLRDAPRYSGRRVAVVLIDPESRVGEIVWPGANHTS